MPEIMKKPAPRKVVLRLPDLDHATTKDTGEVVVLAVRLGKALARRLPLLEDRHHDYGAVAWNNRGNGPLG